MKYSPVYEVTYRDKFFIILRVLCKLPDRKSLKYVSLSDDNLSNYLSEVKSWGFLRRSEVDWRVSGCILRTGGWLALAALCIGGRPACLAPARPALHQGHDSWVLAPLIPTLLATFVFKSRSESVIISGTQKTKYYKR